MKKSRKRRVYPHVREGEWLRPRHAGFRMMCCDCRLVHRINFRVVYDHKGKRACVAMQAFRENRATAAARRRKRPRS